MADNNTIIAGFDDANTQDAPQAQLQIGLKQDAAKTKLTASLIGKLDSSSCKLFAQKMQKALDAGFNSIVLDMALLDYLSSAGVGALAAVLKKTKEKDGTIILQNVSEDKIELFKVLDMDKFFEMQAGKVPFGAAFSAGGAGNAPSNVAGAATANRVQSAAGSAAPASAAAPVPVYFPLVIRCPSCGKALKVPKEGRYRCSGCKAIIKAAASGQVSLG